MSTGDVFLSASSMSSDALAKRMLTPLPEEDDETVDSKSQTHESLIHPEFDIGNTVVATLSLCIICNLVQGWCLSTILLVPKSEKG